MTETTGTTNDWTLRAVCRGVDPGVFIWAEPPVRATADRALAYCNVCPVRAECAQDMADSGERYRYQVRAGLRMWTSEATSLPDPVIYSGPERKPYDPKDSRGGFPSSTHLKDKITLERGLPDEYATPMQIHSHIPTNGRRTQARHPNLDTAHDND